MDTKYKAYWERYFAEFTELLTANSRLPQLTRNSSIIGGFAEAAVEDLVFKSIGSGRCSTGTVMSSELELTQASLRQLDLIIWDSTPFPAVFDRAGFAVVPQQSVHGVLEVKRSAYSGVGSKLKDTLDWVEKNVEGERPVKPEIAAMLRNQPSGAVELPAAGDIFDVDPHYIALGVVCLRERAQSDKILNELVAAGRAVVLQEVNESGAIRTNVSHVAHLLEFLKQARIRGANRLKSSGVNTEGLALSFDEQRPGSLKR